MALAQEWFDGGTKNGKNRVLLPLDQSSMQGPNIPRVYSRRWTKLHLEPRDALPLPHLAVALSTAHGWRRSREAQTTGPPCPGCHHSWFLCSVWAEAAAAAGPVRWRRCMEAGTEAEAADKKLKQIMTIQEQEKFSSRSSAQCAAENSKRPDGRSHTRNVDGGS